MKIISLLYKLIPALFLAASFSAAYASDAEFALKITAIDKNLFPQINLRAYFHDTQGNSQNRLSSGKFSLLENKVPQQITLKPIDSQKTMAFIVDRGVNTPEYAGKVQGCIEKAASYLENLDRMAVYSFSEAGKKSDFSSDAKRFKNIDLSGDDVVPEKTADDVFNLALEQMSGFAGDKNVIYLTADPVWFGDSVKAKVQELSASQSVSVTIVKANPAFQLLQDNSTARAQMAEFAASTGGNYVEVSDRDMIGAVETVMDRIKSNYEIGYTTSMPYSNGQKRTIRLEADYMDKITGADSEYDVAFNLPEINFGSRERVYYYQEVNPASIEKASDLGLSISVSAYFKNNARTGNSPRVEAHIGFGGFNIDGAPHSQERFDLSVNNAFQVKASKYVMPPMVRDEYVDDLAACEVREERIETRYIVNGKGINIKRAGIFWTPYLKNDIQSQWVRVFMTFTPKPIKLDGSVRYALFIYGNSLDAKEHEIAFDGIQLQYGYVPTIYTEEKTFYLGPPDVRTTVVKPMNPRIEYQMK